VTRAGGLEFKSQASQILHFVETYIVKANLSETLQVNLTKLKFEFLNSDSECKT